jgi:hypothetical protein
MVEDCAAPLPPQLANAAAQRTVGSSAPCTLRRATFSDETTGLALGLLLLQAFAKDRYDQHEVHCTFKSVTEKDGDYKVAGDCTVEGNAKSYDFTLTASGDILTFTAEAGARDFPK